MAGQNRIHCYVFDLRSEPRVMVRISEEVDTQKCQTAILRRGNLNHPSHEIQDDTRIYVRCN